MSYKISIVDNHWKTLYSLDQEELSIKIPIKHAGFFYNHLAKSSRTFFDRVEKGGIFALNYLSIEEAKNKLKKIFSKADEEETTKMLLLLIRLLEESPKNAEILVQLA